MSVEQINFLLGLGTLLMQIAGVALIVLYVLSKKIPEFRGQLDMVRPWILPALLILTFVSSAMTLIYSEVLGFAPCGLCWLQRVFMYPLVLLTAVALYKKDNSVYDYVIALSIPGLVIALYQHYLQMGGTEIAPCPVVASAAADCAIRSIFELGYITFPLMAATAFAFIIVLSSIARKK